MSSPYRIRVQFYLEGTQDKLFHELAGIDCSYHKNDEIYLNGVGYKVKEVKRYYYDSSYTHPETGEDEWHTAEEVYEVYVSPLP